jgi:hypothetical protein
MSATLGTNNNAPESKGSEGVVTARFMKSGRPDSNRRRPAWEEGRALASHRYAHSNQSRGIQPVSACAHMWAQIRAKMCPRVPQALMPAPCCRASRNVDGSVGTL